jgi:hypothetical protein
VASDAVATAAPVVHTTEPVTTTAAAPSHSTSDVSHPADTGNVASDAVATAAPVVHTTEPVTTTAAAPSNPTSDVSHVADTGNNVASDAVAIAAPVVHTTEPVTTTAAAPSNPASDVSNPADTLLALATASDAPIQVPGSATTGPANTTPDVHPTAIVGDVIALHDAPPPPANALFNGNQYTDYGVTLSSDVAGSAQHAVSPADAASAQHTSVPVAADVQQHASPPPDIVDTTHPTDQHAIL